MSERDEPQINFRVRESNDKDRFDEALAKQPHIGNATVFFQECMNALCEASEADRQVIMPLRFETRPRSSSTLRDSVIGGSL